MRRSSYRAPKNVLIFNGTRILIAIARSLNTAALLTKSNAQNVSEVCSGKYSSINGYYFRYIHPDIEMEITDLDTLKLEEYDKMCGEERTYKTKKEMAKKRRKLQTKKEITAKEKK